MTIYKDLRAEVRNAISGLAQAASERQLLTLCLDAVQTVDDHRLRAAAPAPSPLRPQMLLTLLTYCYVKGHYDSRDIVAAMSGDRTLRYICAGTPPTWANLRRFRRKHRALVAQCLAWVLKQAWVIKLDEGEASFLGYEWFENDLSALINSEANTRLEAAALMDSMDSE